MSAAGRTVRNHNLLVETTISITFCLLGAPNNGEGARVGQRPACITVEQGQAASREERQRASGVVYSCVCAGDFAREWLCGHGSLLEAAHRRQQLQLMLVGAHVSKPDWSSSPTDVAAGDDKTSEVSRLAVMVVPGQPCAQQQGIQTDTSAARRTECARAAAATATRLMRTLRCVPVRAINAMARDVHQHKPSSIPTMSMISTRPQSTTTM